MKSLDLEIKEPLVERRGINLKTIAIRSALWVALLAAPISWTKYALQKTREHLLQIGQREIMNKDLSETMGRYWEKTAVCDWTYVYHGHHDLE
jgi:hypothetical protein